jgi:hypothetical protein
VLPNVTAKIGGPRHRPERRFVMSEETLGHRFGHRRNQSPKASEMRESSAGQALAKSAVRRSRRDLRHFWTVPAI